MQGNGVLEDSFAFGLGEEERTNSGQWPFFFLFSSFVSIISPVAFAVAVKESHFFVRLRSLS